MTNHRARGTQQDASAAAIYAVAKLSAHPCSPRDVCNVYAYLRSSSSPLLRASPTPVPDDEDDDPAAAGGNHQPRPHPAPPAPADDPSSYYLSDAAYHAAQTRLLRAEARVLHALAFDLHAALPHALAVTYLQALDFLGTGAPSPGKGGGGGGGGSEAARLALGHLNAALLSPQLLYATHQPNALAVAAIYAAARDLSTGSGSGVVTPACEWWEVFDVDREELGFLVVALRSLETWLRDHLARRPALLAGGVLTRAAVRDELRSRGIDVAANCGRGEAQGSGPVVSEEEAMMRQMDEKMED